MCEGEYGYITINNIILFQDHIPITSVDSFVRIPYYFYLGSSNLPKKKVIEKELSEYIENELSSCIKNFETFNELGYDFNTGEASVDSSLGKQTRIKVRFPII